MSEPKDRAPTVEQLIAWCEWMADRYGQENGRVTAAALLRLQESNAELLAILRYVVENFDLPDAEYSSLERAAIRKARAAIARAEGKG